MGALTGSSRRILAIAGKEVWQLARDRLTFGMIVGIPLLQMALFGYAINTDVRHLHAGVANLSGSQRSLELVADAQASQVVDIVAQAGSAEALLDLMRRGRAQIGIYLPPDFDRRLAQGRTTAASLFVDGSDPIVLAAARGLAQLGVPAAGPAVFELRNFYNPERRTAVNIVPALMGVILTMTMVLFTSIAIVRERERGNLELLITTPVRTPELMLGKVLPYVGIGLIQVTLVLWAGRWLFAVPVNGSLLDVYLAALVFIVASLTLGLLISTFAQTQFQSMQLTFFVFLPSILLSGFMFPFDGMPQAARVIAEVLPLTHFIRLIRGIMLRAADIGDLQGDIRALGLFSVAALALAIARFRKRLD